MIPETLKQMLEDEDFQKAQKALKKEGQKALSKQERIRRQRALDQLGIPSFKEFCQDNYIKDMEKKKGEKFVKTHHPAY